jgi:hypothetical protein
MGRRVHVWIVHTSGSEVKVPVTTSTYMEFGPVAIVPMDV